MKTFKELEAEYVRTPISTKGVGESTGILSLKGDDTIVELVSDQMFHRKADKNGWFDLILETSAGTPVLLHHALRSGATHFGPGSRQETKIFPNTVVLGPAAEAEGIKTITFSLEGLSNFFHYPHIESQSGYRTEADLFGLVQQMREETARLIEYPVRDELIRPDEIYFVHRFPRAMKFQVEDRYYSVGFIRRVRGLGGSSISVSVEPLATIGFREPVAIDAALDRLWEWREFFIQMAMEPMQVTAISVQETVSHRSASADLYLPGAKRERRGRSEIHPAELPLNQWEDRTKLRDVMQEWLRRSRDRRTFRAYLNNVIEASARRSDIQDVVRLCSAVESLSELVEESDISKEDVKTMANAAHAKMADSSRSIDNRRIFDVLSILRQMSLSKRLDLIAATTAPAIEPVHAMAIFGAAKELRNSAAHGRSIADERTPIIGPITDGLAAICAAYDLLSCGMPQDVIERRRLVSLRTVSRAAFELTTLTNS